MKLPTMTEITTIILGSLLFTSTELVAGLGYFTSSPMNERQVPMPLSAILCARPATADDLFKNGVFDAQVQVIRLNPKANSKVTLQQAKDRAKKLASDHQQSAYTQGLCPDGGAWVMAFPSADPITIQAENLKIPLALNRSCVTGTMKASFVPEGRGRSLALSISKNNIANLPSARGYAAVSCVLNQNRNGGPRELALVPVGGSSLDVASIGKKSLSKIEESLSAWVNEKRRLENLPTLSENIDLNFAAKSLIGKKIIVHNLETLASMRQPLFSKGVEPIGENRVQGRDMNELAGLLWISPMHRDLILNPTADVIGVSTSKDENGVFAVMVIGKKSGGAVAKSLIKP